MRENMRLFFDSAVSKSVLIAMAILIMTCPAFIGYAQDRETASANDLLLEYFRAGDTRFSAEKMCASQNAELTFWKPFVESKNLHSLLQRKIDEAITPGDRMKAIDLELKRWKAQGRSLNDVFDAHIGLHKSLRPTATGSISGTITSGGDPAFSGVWAYDEYGYVAGNGISDWTTGQYTIDQLLPGNYFVVTNAFGLIDEFYDDITLDPAWENWRLVIDGGHLVAVQGGQDTPGIDFDLESEPTAQISGMIYEADGVTPINLVNVWPDFKLTYADSETELFIPSFTRSSNGSYEVDVTELGSFKFSVTIDGYAEQYYDKKENWATADIITVNSFDDVITGIDFHLGEAGPVVEPGGTISGAITGPLGQNPVPFGFAVAFDATDYSVAGWGVTSILNGGTFEIAGLPEGDYYVYADDMGGNLLGVPNLIGEYYDGARTPDLATAVTVVEGETTADIDFTLDIGGGIQGNVTDDAGTPLDSIFVIAFNAELPGLEFEAPLAEFLFEHLGELCFDVDLTDPSGDYNLDGLPAGDYIVRTFSMLGKRAFTVFDEYYDDVENILDIDQATPVSVASITTDIDFVLDRGGMITGTVYAADGVTPIEDVIVIAVDAVTELPAATKPDTTDETGAFVIPLLHTGDYKLLAIPDASEEPFYLVEFHDGARDLENAGTVAVTEPNTTAGIVFTLDIGGFIQGIVSLSPGYRAGADTLWGFPVIAYDVLTGRVAGVSTVTFSGGYRIGQLPAGTYIVGTIPATEGYGVTYFGGGETYDDPNTALVNVNPGDSTRADITVTPAHETISGSITLEATGEPFVSMVLALDATGHATSFALSGTDRTTGENLASPGDYILYGIRSGEWFVRTWAFFGIFNLINTLTAEEEPGMAKPGCCRCRCVTVIDEAWNDKKIPAEKDYVKFEYIFLKNTKMTVISYSIKDYYHYYGIIVIPKRWYRLYTPVSNWDKVMVSGMAKRGVSGIDFALSDTRDTEVAGEITVIPAEYGLEQNHPNPFNPETAIRYHLPKDAVIELAIYNLVGQHVTTLVSGTQTAGIHTVTWNGRNDLGQDVPSGIYVYRIQAGDFTASRKLTLIR